MPLFLRDLAVGQLVTLDVRPFFERGEEPFMAIMFAADKLAPGQVLKLVASFEPVPLYGVLGHKGFAHWSQPAGGGAWEIYFFAEQEDHPPSPTEAEKDGGDDSFAADEGGDIIELDVRGLEAPEPLERILATIEQMSYGSVLLVRHNREPLILFDILAERDLGYHSNKLGQEEWEIRIWRRN